MPRTEQAKAVRLKDYRPTPYAIRTVDLDIRLGAHDTVVTARLAMERRNGTRVGTPLHLDGDELALVSIALDGTPLAADAYKATAEELTLTHPPAGPFTLTIVTRLDPAANTKLMGLYRTSGNYCTQCEAEGFRRITYFLDRPDVLAVYTTRLEAAKAEAPVLLANGNLVEAGDVPGTDRHFAVWHDPFPKPAYLFAMVAGDLAVARDRFVTRSGREVKLEIYVEHGKEDRVAYAMDALKRSMAWDETAFGREYDLDVFMIVAVSDFNMGAMENKGLNVFNDKYVLAKPETATDVDYAGIESVIAHEYFHNWTGNRITCRDWFQLCLKEGLTVFRDQEFTSDTRSRAVKRISDVRLLKSHQFPEDAGPLAHPVRPEQYHEINNFYTATVYEKGAEVVRMIRTLLGPDGFRAGMDLYFARHDGDAATVENFVACFAEANGVDLSQFMLWYQQSGTPEVIVTSRFDAARGELTLDFAQSLGPTPGQPSKKPMAIPVRFGLVGADGRDVTPAAISGADVRGDVIVLKDPSHRVVFSGLSERPVPSLLRGFSAPVKLGTDLDARDQLFLLANDADPFNRWHAAQVLSTRALVAATEVARAGRPPVFEARLLDAMARITGDESLDPAFRAQLLTPPGEADIARDIGVDVDPDAIAIARLELRRALGRHLAPVLGRVLDRLVLAGPYSPDATAAGIRALRTVALDLLAQAGEASAVARVEAQYRAADNMTDRFGALAVAVTQGLPFADALLADFYGRFEGDALVIDKWFSVQATAPAAGTLARVQALREHPAFSMANPNRVRSLIGAFATGNQTQFNRADGAGFEFVADAVIELDDRNPQVAARLLSSFRSWRALESGRRALAEKALKRVAAKPAISADVADIAGRSLG